MESVNPRFRCGVSASGAAASSSALATASSTLKKNGKQHILGLYIVGSSAQSHLMFEVYMYYTN